MSASKSSDLLSVDNDFDNCDPDSFTHSSNAGTAVDDDDFGNDVDADVDWGDGDVPAAATTTTADENATVPSAATTSSSSTAPTPATPATTISIAATRLAAKDALQQRMAQLEANLLARQASIKAASTNASSIITAPMETVKNPHVRHNYAYIPMTAEALAQPILRLPSDIIHHSLANEFLTDRETVYFALTNSLLFNSLRNVYQQKKGMTLYIATAPSLVKKKEEEEKKKEKEERKKKKLEERLIVDQLNFERIDSGLPRLPDDSENEDEDLSDSTLDSSSSSSSRTPPVTRQVKAIFDHPPRKNLTELNFVVDDVITVSMYDNEGWCEGELNGKVGIFPRSYVINIPESSSSSSSSEPAEPLSKPILSRDPLRKTIHVFDTSPQSPAFISAERHSVSVLIYPSRDHPDDVAVFTPFHATQVSSRRIGVPARITVTCLLPTSTNPKSEATTTTKTTTTQSKVQSLTSKLIASSSSSSASTTSSYSKLSATKKESSTKPSAWTDSSAAVADDLNDEEWLAVVNQQIADSEALAAATTAPSKEEGGAASTAVATSSSSVASAAASSLAPLPSGIDVLPKDERAVARHKAVKEAVTKANMEAAASTVAELASSSASSSSSAASVAPSESFSSASTSPASSTAAASLLAALPGPLASIPTELATSAVPTTASTSTVEEMNAITEEPKKPVRIISYPRVYGFQFLPPYIRSLTLTESCHPQHNDPEVPLSAVSLMHCSRLASLECGIYFLHQPEYPQSLRSLTVTSDGYQEPLSSFKWWGSLTAPVEGISKKNLQHLPITLPSTLTWLSTPHISLQLKDLPPRLEKWICGQGVNLIPPEVPASSSSSSGAAAAEATATSKTATTTSLQTQYLLPPTLTSIILLSESYFPPNFRPPPNLRYLEFGPACNPKLGNFKWQDEKEEYPCNLTHLKLGVGFKSPSLQQMKFPSSLQKFEFDTRSLYDAGFHPSLQMTAIQSFSLPRYWNQDIYDLYLPYQLRDLEWSQSMNQRIDALMFPSTLTRIVFGRNFNQSLEAVRFPSGLKHLEFSTEDGRFRGPLSADGLAHCRELETLILGSCWNRPNEELHLAPTITMLKFGDAFNQPVVNLNLPSSLTYLQFGESFNQDLSTLVLPSRLEKFELTNEIRFSRFQHLESLMHLKLPESVWKIVVPIRASPKLDKELQERYQTYLDVLPFTVTVVAKASTIG